MSIEQAMILRAQPQALARKLSAAIDREVTKGCTRDISPLPVRLEPPFSPLLMTAHASDVTSAFPYVVAARDELVDPVRLRVWISPEQKFDWKHSELWLKQLADTSDRVAFQIAGNKEAIEVLVLCAPRDELLIKATFEAQFNMCEITSADASRLEGVPADAWAQAQFLDFFPPPPYSHMLTCSNELHTSPFEALLTTMRLVPDTAIAFYQCVFQPVHPTHDWHRNVSQLLDLEFAVKLHNSPASSFRALQQTPSGDLHRMAGDVEIKAHNDKPFFAAAVRMGVVGCPATQDRYIRPLASMLRLFQHGGRPLESVSQSNYQGHVGIEDVRRMFISGLTHRAGFLVNSQELAGLVHVFPASIRDARKIEIEVLPALPFRSENLTTGTRIGTCRYAGVDYPVCVPLGIRECSVHAVSAPKHGKTTVLINMMLQDVETTGCVFIDAHGDAMRDLLRLIPRRHRSRCIYFNPGDRDWIPLWNPLIVPAGGDVYRLADDLVSVFKRVFTDWGDRLEHVMRNGLIGLGQLPNACLLDLYSLVRQTADESEVIRRQIIHTAVDEPVRKFWEHDFLKDYKKSDLQAPKHKLSKLVSAGPVSLMLSQPHSLINFRSMMDEGGILLVDLSSIGADVRQVLGSFILTIFLMAAISRGDTTIDKRRRFSIYVDEAHLFVSADAIEDIITQARKFHVNISLAHQYLKQFPTAKIDALSTVGCTILGRLDKHDSQYFIKDLQDRVDPAQIVSLPPFEMFARIGTDIVRMKTRPLPEPEDPDGTAEIVENSRRRYCRPASEVRQWIRNRAVSRQEPFAAADPTHGEHGFTEEHLRYEEF
jgi:hypothetical protein